MSEDQFTKLFKYVEKRFDSVDKQFEQNRKEHSEMMASIADLSGQIRDYHQELIMMGRKVDRLERWLLQIAQETGVKLDYLAD